MILLQQSELMQENKQDGKRTHIFHKEEIKVEQPNIADALQRPLVRKFIPDNMVGHKPTDKNTSKETHNGQENLTCDKVKPVEQRLTEESQSLYRSH